MAKDLYAILGLTKGASPEDVKKAYRSLSKEWHPDKHKGDKAAETKFKEINEAYEVLGNPEKKTQYDHFGSYGQQQGGGGAGGFGGFDFSGFSGGNTDFGDLFENFFGGGARGRPRDRTKGDDHEIELRIDFSDVLTGVRHTVNMRKFVLCGVCEGKGAEPGTSTVTCPTCNGTGQVTRTAQSFFGAIQQRSVCPECQGAGTVPEKPCGNCKGEGRLQETSQVTIDVPPGIADGQTLRIRGQGDAGRRGGEAGDLFVHIRVPADPRFEREDADIRSAVSVPVVDAILGGQVDVPTVHGPSTVQVPAGMQPGQTFRIRGKGLPVLNTHRFGDHYVTINVDIPTKLSRAERKIVEEWREIQ